MENFSDFLKTKLAHLRQYYKTDQEFNDHLESGEVTIPFPDVIKYVEEYESISEESPEADNDPDFYTNDNEE